jgi:cytochrome c
MTPFRVAAAWLVVAAVTGSIRTLTAVAGQSPSGGRPTIGEYSMAQADRGADAYQRACATCHKADLRGDADAEVPALVDDEFLVAWERLSIGDLMTRVSRTMPGNRPGSLTRREYLDIVAFLLRANRFPSGPNDLPDDDNALSKLFFRQD